MNRYLTTTALATSLLLSGGGLAAAQGQQPQGQQPQGQQQGAGQAGPQAQAGSQGQPQAAQQGAGQAGSQQAQPGQAQGGQGAIAGQLRTVEQSLRHAERQLSGGQGDQPPNYGQARTAVSAGQDVLGKVPPQVQDQNAYSTARRELQEAQQALSGQQPDRQQAATRLREAAEAVAELHRNMGGGNNAAAAGTAAGAAGGAQIAVQQRAPEITVQQPPPQVTVQQPQPQVTIQQPPPQVTVQQPQPQVTVQQAQPQVHVQQQGQPQVNVERQGQPQVQVERQGQQQAGDQRNTGTSAAPAPAQSGGNTQRATVSPGVTGVPLARVQNLVGTNVVGADGKDAGEIQNLLIDGSGQVRAAVVEWGGFLGIGERSAAVPIDRIQLGAAGSNDRARLTMTKEELERLPRYDRNRVGEYGREQGWGDGIRLFR